MAPPAQQALVPLSAELGLSQNVGWQGVQGRLQWRAGIGEGYMAQS